MSNVPAFPEIIEGGIKGPATILLIGEGGTGRSFITRKFALEALEEDENCIYFCTSHSLKSVRQRVDWVETYEKKEKNILVDAYPGRVGEPTSEYYINNPENPSKYEELLDTLMEEEYPSRIILDRFDTLPQWIGKENAIRLLKRLLGYIESCGGIGLYIVTEGVLSSRMEMLAREKADLTLHTDRLEGEKYAEIFNFPLQLSPHQKWKIDMEGREISLSELQES